MSGLEVQSLSVRFGGHLAVSDVSLEIPRGQITGLIGPNGAGKTTTFNAICGVVSLSSGRVLLDGVDISKLKTFKRSRKGIGRTFQRLEVFGSLTVRENIQVGLEIRRSWSRRKPDLIQYLAEDQSISPADEVDLILDRLDLTGLADLSVSSLPTGHARLVELGRALAARPSVLLLDEPASGLDDSETDDFGDLLISLAGNGLGILLVEHDVALVMRICQSLAVLDFGNIIAKGAPEEVRSNQAVLAAYLGSTPTSIAGGPSSVADSSGNPLAAGNGVVA
ncbi:MAG: ABC transporter ATP-binding protein [Microthrixaceae bacterium]